MSSAGSGIRFDTSPLTGIIASLKGAGRPGGGGPYDVMFKRWAARYAGFTRRRFDVLSKGGSLKGKWAPLAPSTIAKRRKGRTAKKKRPAILVDTALLKNATSINAQGNFTGRIPDGIRFGFANAPHPSSGKGLTFRQLAEIHQNGNPARGLPARPILVEPDNITVLGMQSDLSLATKRAARRRR